MNLFINKKFTMDNLFYTIHKIHINNEWKYPLIVNFIGSRIIVKYSDRELLNELLTDELILKYPRLIEYLHYYNQNIASYGRHHLYDGELMPKFLYKADMDNYWEKYPPLRRYLISYLLYYGFHHSVLSHKRIIDYHDEILDQRKHLDYPNYQMQDLWYDQYLTRKQQDKILSIVNLLLKDNKLDIFNEE